MLIYVCAHGRGIKKTAKYIKVLGDANCLAIIHAIGKSSFSVSDIINATELSRTLISFHLRALREHAIVTTQHDGPFIYYRLTVPELYVLSGELSRVARIENGFSQATPSLERVKQNRR